MALYFHNYRKQDSREFTLINDLLKELDVKVISFSYGTRNIDSSMYLALDKDKTFVISEFPGNCSTLIISRVQMWFEYYDSEFLNRFLEVGEKLGRLLGYGSIVVTGTNLKFIESLHEKGYVTNYTTHNPHSGLTNYFLSKDIVE